MPATNTWHRTMTPRQRNATKAVLAARAGRGSGNGYSTGWSVYMAPTTRTPRVIEVRCRDEFGRLCARYPVDATP